MIQHFLSVGAAVLLTLWAVVVTQYQHFHTPTIAAEAPAHEIVIQSPGIGTSSPSPFDTVITQILNAASSSAPAPATTTKPAPKAPVGPVQPATPPVPFKPLPVPTPPPVVPTSPANPAPSVPATPVVPITPPIDTTLAGEALLRSAIVNIICLPGGGIGGFSGSGIVIDPRGIILTVAHVGQGFLLRDYPSANAGSCYIRTGSPAQNAYAADLIFISPSWLKENQLTFLANNPAGTGENDFAILAITKSISGKALPSRYSYIPLSPAGTKIQEDDNVGTGSYAAEFLTNDQIRSSLYPTIKFADVADVYTFGHNTTDIFSVAAGSAAQEGSSGGAVMNDDNELIGLISTRTAKPDLALRSLQAITMDHIRRSFKADMGADLDSYLKGNLSTLVASFKPKAASLLSDIEEEIQRAR